MYVEERRALILKYLIENERGTVNYFSCLFGVSKETIRHDLNTLKNLSFIKRCHGGAIISRKSIKSEFNSDTEFGVYEILNQVKNSALNSSNEVVKNMNGKVCVFGSFNVDIVAKVSRFPKGGESLMACSSSIGPGGKGSNQAVAASKAGAQVHFVAKVGKDQFSQMATDHLVLSDIHSFNLYQSNTEPTGSAIIYVAEDNGENMIAVHSGANVTVSSKEVQGIIPELESSNILLLQLENNLDAISSLAKIAKEMEKTVILNPAPFSPEVRDILQYIDIITPNETEASLLSGIEITNYDSAKEAALIIKSLGVNTVLITMGSRGALLFHKERFHHIKPCPSVVVDTTGAGDAFNGAFAASLASGKSLLKSAELASAFASLAVELEGASSMPSTEVFHSRYSMKNSA